MVPRELGYVLQSSLDIHPRWYVDGDGRLNMTKLLTAFSTFFGEHAEHWLAQLGAYREAAPQLILQSYLQRVVNSGGRIEREYGLERGRTDLLVLWPREAGQPSDLWERFVVECKVLRDMDRKSLARTVECGVKQTLGYMARGGAGDTSWKSGRRRRVPGGSPHPNRRGRSRRSAGRSPRPLPHHGDTAGLVSGGRPSTRISHQPPATDAGARPSGSPFPSGSDGPGGRVYSGSELWVPSQNGAPPVRLQPQSQTFFASASESFIGVNPVSLCEPSQKGCRDDFPHRHQK